MKTKIVPNDIPLNERREIIDACLQYGKASVYERLSNDKDAGIISQDEWRKKVSCIVHILVRKEKIRIRKRK